MTTHASYGGNDHLEALEQFADAAERRGLSQRGQDIRDLVRHLRATQVATSTMTQVAASSHAESGTALHLPASMARRLTVFLLLSCILLAIVIAVG